MQISCPGCKSRIQIPEDRLKPQGTKVKCGKCAKIFTVKRAGKQGPPSQPGPVAKPADSDIFTGDNFGAEMDNYRTQLRPMANERVDDLFGSLGDLDSSPAPTSPTRGNTDHLFGSAEDLDQPLGEPEPAHSSSSDDLLDKLAADIRATSNEIAAEEPRTVKPPRHDSLDDIFGDGLGTGSAASKGDGGARRFDDLLSEPPVAPTPAAFDALLSDEPEIPRPVRNSPIPQATPTRQAPSTANSGGPSPEQIASEMDLRPALREEDVPKIAAPSDAAVAPKVSPKTSGSRKITRRLALLVLLLLVVAGSAGAFFYIPSVHQTIEGYIQKLPHDKILALFGEAPAMPEPMLLEVDTPKGKHLRGPGGDTMYIVQGMVTNGYPASRSFIKVRAYLLDDEGQVFATRDVFAGNVLSDDELRGLTRVRIEGILNREVGAGLSNFNLPAGSKIPYQFVFYDAIHPPSQIKVEPISSVPGS